MATGVVLYHRTPWHQVGARHCISIWTPDASCVIDQQGLDWGSSDVVLMLKKRIKNIIEKGASLIDVIQVMLIRRSLPCQRRPLRMWEFNPEGPQTLKRFFGMTHEAIWKLLFKTQKSWPETSEDIALDYNHPSSLVTAPFPNIT